MELSICARVSGDRPRNSTPIPWPIRWRRTTAEQVMNVSAFGSLNRKFNTRLTAYVACVLRKAPRTLKSPNASCLRMNGPCWFSQTSLLKPTRGCRLRSSMGRSARPLNGASLITIAIRVAASEPAAAFYRPSGGIGVGIGTVQLAGVFRPQDLVLRGNPGTRRWTSSNKNAPGLQVVAETTSMSQSRSGERAPCARQRSP